MIRARVDTVAVRRSLSGRKATQRQRLAAISLAAAAGATGCGWLAWWGQSHARVGLIVAMALLAPAPLVVRFIQGRWDPFEPINLMMIGILVLFVWRPAVELIQHLNTYSTYDAILGFQGAMVMGLVGTAALYAGYYSRAGTHIASRFAPLADSWDADRSVIFARRLLYIGAFLTLLYIAQAGPSYVLSTFSGRHPGQANLMSASSGYFEQGQYLTIPASLILLVAFAKKPSWGTGSLLCLCIFLALAVTIAPGDRTYILELLLPLVTLWYLRRNRRPRLISILVAFVVFVMFINIELAFRTTTQRAGKSVPAAVANAVLHPTHELTKFITGPDPAGFSVLEIEWHAYQTGFLKYQPGSTIRNIAIGWIPHQVFGDHKPLTPLQYVTWTLFPATLDQGSFQPPMFGSMFVDYGWPAVLVLSLLVGIVLRSAWEYFLRMVNSGGMQIVFAGFLPMVAILLRDDIDDIFYRSVFIVLPLILCVRVCSRPPKRRSRFGFAQRVWQLGDKGSSFEDPSGAVVARTVSGDS